MDFSTAMAPVQEHLKDLHLHTDLVVDGDARAIIVAPASGRYDESATVIQSAILAATGVEVRILPDDGPAGDLPLAQNAIVLGNRSTNRLIGALYDRYYTLLDLRYPGPGGHVLRSLHNPFGNGCNALLVGGSDDAGIATAATVLSECIGAAAEGQDLRLGWLMEIRLGDGVEIPEHLEDFEIWEASAGYGSVGYFGWNSLSKRMAMYYMTGDAHHAREFLRLAFPDAQARDEIAAIDGERVENKDDPLGGSYHYNAHMMILYWDLIEESPVFTDAERLRITNAFARQFFHAEDRAWRGQIHANAVAGREDAYDVPPPHVGSRHGQWSAVCLYCLGRYFDRDYPAPLWRHCKLAAAWHFAPLHEHAWVGGENDNLFWYNTGIAPIVAWLLLTGDREPLRNGMLARLLTGLDVLISGRTPDWALSSAALGFLHKTAHLTGDGRYLEYRRRTGIDVHAGPLRLGQSFWPGPDLEPAQPLALVGHWTVQPLPEPMWRTRTSGVDLAPSFLYASYRNAADDTGDFVLIKGMNGASRNPFHTFVVLELRLSGSTVLAGYLNQVFTRDAGRVADAVSMDAALLSSAVVGPAATAVAEVPVAGVATWRRTLVHRTSRYTLFHDRLDFPEASDCAEVEMSWQSEADWEALPQGGLQAVGHEIHTSRVWSSSEVAGGTARLVWRGPVAAGERQHLFSLLTTTAPQPVGCDAIDDTSALLYLPEPALAVAGAHAGHGIDADLAVIAGDHLHGMGVRHVEFGELRLQSEHPMHVDWDLDGGVLDIEVSQAGWLRLGRQKPGGTPRLDGAPLAVDDDGTLQLDPGRHVFDGLRLDDDVRSAIVEGLAAVASSVSVAPVLGAGVGDGVSLPLEGVAALPVTFRAEVGAAIVDLILAETGAGARLCAATDDAVHVLSARGEPLVVLPTDGPVRVLHWWPETGLLLVGCADEQVIAFDLDSGERQWVFRSEMDPAVLRAAKTYWFKSQPGHEGVHGLHSGLFLDGANQAFVGSACTLEILDPDGNLAHRVPVFWGPGSRFALIDGDDGRPELLIAREPTDSHALAIVDQDLSATRRVFDAVPGGHTDIRGWACMSRRHLCYTDLDGHGEKRVVSEINGTWNRLTVWNRQGEALHSVNLGPGGAIPARNITGFGVLGRDGDVRTLVSCLAGGYVLAFDPCCRPLWSRHLAAAPTLLEADDTHVWIGLYNGSVVAFDGQGEAVGQATVVGSPTRAVPMGGGLVVATQSGELACIRATGDPSGSN